MITFYKISLFHNLSTIKVGLKRHQRMSEKVYSKKKSYLINNQNNYENKKKSLDALRPFQEPRPFRRVLKFWVKFDGIIANRCMKLF